MLIEQQRRPSAPTPNQQHRARATAAEAIESGGGQAQKFHRTSVCSFQDTNLSELRRGRRINGLQLPLHPLQVIGWLTVVIFALSTFLVVIPALKEPLHSYILALITGLFVVHIGSHLAALILDPADRELRRQHNSSRIIPEFDRIKHRHVIENGRCHLCNIKTSGPRTKHCSVCNKCVGKFDHHCKWLNSCVGSRNYSAFLLCIFSSVILTLTIAGITLELVLYYFVSPHSLNLWTEINVTSTGTPISSMSPSGDDNSTTNLLNVVPGGASPNSINSTLDGASAFPVEDTLFLVFISVVGLLATICCALLIHLCFFHIYISFLGLTTYEYIRNQRQLQQQQQQQTGNQLSQPPPSQSSSSQQASRNEQARAEELAAASPVNEETVATERVQRRGTATSGRLKNSSSIDRIYFCSSLNKGGNKTAAGKKHSSNPLTRYFLDNNNKVDVAVEEGSASVAVETALKAHCVICSLIEIDPSQSKNLLCCTKVYNRHQVAATASALDVDPEDALVLPMVATPNKSRWCSKLYCCVNVPDSPDTHLDVCDSLNVPSGSCPTTAETSHGGVGSPSRLTTENNVFKITLPEDANNPQLISVRPTRFRVDPDRKYNRLRRLLRAVKFQRNVNERLVKDATIHNSDGGGALKINQIRPLSSATIASKSVTPPSPAVANHHNNTLAPSPRRKLRARADLKGYIDYLAGSSSSPIEQLSGESSERSPAESFSPPLNTKLDPNLFSRRARKKTFRNHSPKLSPIKESGLSNPASPAPSRSQLFPAIS